MSDTAAAEAVPLSDTQLSALVPGVRIVQYKDLAGATSIEPFLDAKRRLVLLYPIRSDADGHWTCGFFDGAGVFRFQDSYGKPIDAELVHSKVPEAPRSLTHALAGTQTSYNSHVLQASSPGIDTCGRHVACRLAHTNLDDDAYATMLGADGDAYVAAWTIRRGGPDGGGGGGGTEAGGSIQGDPLADALDIILDAADALPRALLQNLPSENDEGGCGDSIVSGAVRVAAEWYADPQSVSLVCQWAGALLAAAIGTAGVDTGSVFGSRLYFSIRRPGQPRYNWEREMVRSYPRAAPYGRVAGVAMNKFRDALVQIMRNPPAAQTLRRDATLAALTTRAKKKC